VSVDRGSGVEPGLDLHLLGSAWASVEEDARDDPDAALSQFAELVHRLLVSSGYAVDDPVGRQGGELEIVKAYLAARETTERAEIGEASLHEVELAIEDLRAIFDALTGDLLQD
jgi:hypothetical protein